MNPQAEATAHEFSEIFPMGTHVCHIFNNDRDRAKTLAKFMASSIATRQKVLNIVDTITPPDLREELKSMGIDFSSAEKDVVTVDNESAYCPAGSFDPDALLSGAISFCQQAFKDGYAGSRVYGDMSWVLRKNVSHRTLIEYEAKVTDYVKIPPCAAICEYDARKFDGSTLMDILRIHPAIIVSAQIVKNPYFIPPNEFLARYKTEHVS